MTAAPISRWGCSIAVGFIAGLGALPEAAAATETQAQAIEEVVVTARRRDETLFETPVSASVIGEEQIRTLRLDNIDEMMRLVPNATVPTDSEGINTFIVIRGIRQPDPQIEPNFGLYRNGIFYGGSRTNLSAQVDVARVEVLRGSQGGLYGRDSSGGAVNIVYATPTHEFDSYGRATYGEYDRKDVEGMVNVPVSDNFAVRAAGWYFDTDGGQFQNDLRHDNMDFLQEGGLRLTSDWTISDALSLLVTGEFIDSKGPSFLTYSPAGVVDFLTLIGGPGQSRPPEQPDSIQRDTKEYNKIRQYYISENLEWETEVGKFNLLGSFRTYQLDGKRDGDSDNFQPSDGFFASSSVRWNKEDVDNSYVELLWTSNQTQKLTWLTGVSYYEEKFDFERRIDNLFDFDVTVLDPTVTGVHLVQIYLPERSPLETKSYSGFVEFDYDFTEKFRAFASLRYIHDDKSIDYKQYTTGDDPDAVRAIFGDPSIGDFGAFGFFGLLFPNFSTKVDDTFTDWLPGGGVSYQFNDDVNLYASVETGMRPGGFNTTTTQPSNIPYDSEEAITYELGVKTLLLDRRVALNANIFDFRQDNYLLFAEDPINPFFSALVNVGKAETYGFEFDASSQLTPWLFSAVTYGYMHPEITHGVNFGTDISGAMIPRVRKHNASLVLMLDYPLSYEGLHLVGSVNGSWEFGGYEDPAETQNIADLSLINVSLGVSRDKWRLIGFVDNVLDDTITQFTYGFPNVQDQTKDRRWGIQLSYSY
jgi:iron complex outermembrane recepter protein